MFVKGIQGNGPERRLGVKGNISIARLLNISHQSSTGLSLSNTLCFLLSCFEACEDAICGPKRLVWKEDRRLFSFPPLRPSFELVDARNAPRTPYNDLYNDLVRVDAEIDGTVQPATSTNNNIRVVKVVKTFKLVKPCQIRQFYLDL